jgi:shikimate kinase
MPTSPASSTRHLVLVGMMGSGKTTVGHRLAERLGRPFVDSDEQVEWRTGRTVRQIFEDDGEAAFRSLESEALAEALGSTEPAVVAAAGGVVLSADNRRLLGDHLVVWLRAGARALAHRVQAADHRPLLEGDPEGVLRRLVEERRSLYEEVADVIVDVDDEDAGAVVDIVLASL